MTEEKKPKKLEELRPEDPTRTYGGGEKWANRGGVKRVHTRGERTRKISQNNEGRNIIIKKFLPI